MNKVFLIKLIRAVGIDIFEMILQIIKAHPEMTEEDIVNTFLS